MVFVSKNIKAFKNVVEDKPHFFMKVVDNHLRTLAMFTKHFIAMEKISLTGSKLMDKGEDCLEGYDGADGGEVNGRGVVLGVFKR
uniref:Uncharacterized protein n=1 Tax=Tanacetum cinerariifolium TaxID=118510 RepID=A0A699I0I1_TANCI|nr:hypothetical protein [Tanacetum cinerariifolium]